MTLKLEGMLCDFKNEAYDEFKMIEIAILDLGLILRLKWQKKNILCAMDLKSKKHSILPRYYYCKLQVRSVGSNDLPFEQTFRGQF